jgi:hypothetical protein
LEKEKKSTEKEEYLKKKGEKWKREKWTRKKNTTNGHLGGMATIPLLMLSHCGHHKSMSYIAVKCSVLLIKFSL